MTALTASKQSALQHITYQADKKRLSILPTDNTLDHVSWSAMTVLVLKYNDAKTSEIENRHIEIMAAHIGMTSEQFIADMGIRIERGLVMSTGVLIGVNTALKMVSEATSEEEIAVAIGYYDQYMNFF